MTDDGLACRNMIQKALKHYQLPNSESAVRLLCMIAAHESGGFVYSKQVRGPAVSIFQMEPKTFKDLTPYCQSHFPELAKELPCSSQRMIFFPEFAAAMGRAFFMRIREALPDHDNINDLARYAKQYWNTRLGKATESQYADAYKTWFED